MKFFIEEARNYFQFRYETLNESDSERENTKLNNVVLGIPIPSYLHA